MRFNFKEEPLYPSIGKPGIFLYDMDEENLWEEYTNIIETEIDRYKFTLGTWEEHRTQSRMIRILENNYVDGAILGIGEDVLPSEIKPDTPPAGFVDNTEENLTAIITGGFNTKPPDVSNKIYDSGRGDHGPMRYAPMFGLWHSTGTDNDGRRVFKLGNNAGNTGYYINVPQGDSFISGDWKGGIAGTNIPTDNNFLPLEDRPGIDTAADQFKYHIDDLYQITYYTGDNEHTVGDQGAAGLVYNRYRARDVWGLPVLLAGLGFDVYRNLDIVNDIHWHRSIENDPQKRFIEFPDDTHPQFKFINPIVESTWGGDNTPLFEPDPRVHLAGWWKVTDVQIIKQSFLAAAGAGWFRAAGRAIKNSLFTPNKSLGEPHFVKYKWSPNLHKDPRFSKVGSLSPEQQWKWTKVGPSHSGMGMEVNGIKTDFDWVSSEPLLLPPQIRKPLNRYVGVAFSSTEEDPNIGLEVPGEMQNKGLPIYYEPGTFNYFNSSSPLKIFFGVNLFEQDVRLDENGASFDSNIFKYHVVQWDDEEEKLSSEEILNTEFFKLYDQEEETFDRSQAKRLLQIIRDAKYFRKDGAMDLTEHTYLTPGVKNIKTVIFRLSNGEEYLLETILINTNIVINDPQEELQNFSIFGANNFTTLPLSVKTNDLIIGGIDEESEYIKSLKTVKRDSLFTGDDFLEKNYTIKFLEKFKNGSYGENNSNVDISTTRIFKKPRDIYHFITNDIFEKMEIINNQNNLEGISLPSDSLATDILIGDNDCMVELNPKNSIHYTIQNTGQSDAVGIMIGDYSLEKDEELPLEKANEMEIPKLEDKKDKQAY